MAFARAGDPNRSVFFVANHSYSTNPSATENPAADAESLVVRNFLRTKVESHKIALLDMRALAGTFADIAAANWKGSDNDGVSPTSSSI